MAEGSENLDTVFKVIENKKIAKGLAIIIGNQYSQHPALSKEVLDGPIADRRVMTHAFQRLNYAVLSIKNASKQTITRTIKDVIDYFPLSPKELCYKRFVFVFAGHGDDTNSIHTHDGVVNIYAEVISPLLPEKAPHLQEIPKFFFIDACRSSLPDAPVPRGGGCGSISTMANYMLVYSTYLSQIAVETRDGGDWMQMLASELLLPDNLNKTISEICVNVNAKLRTKLNKLGRQFMQQPVGQSTLHTVVKFLDEAKELQERYRLEPISTALGGQSVSYSQPYFTGAAMPGSFPMINRIPNSAHNPTQHLEFSAPPPSSFSSQFQGRRGGTSPVNECTKPSSVELLKCKLEMCRPDPKIDYTVKEIERGYEAAVCAPLIGYAISDECSTEEEAIQSAAVKALEKLTRLHK